MDKIAIINELYFVEKKNLTEIAQIIETSVSYISRIEKNALLRIRNKIGKEL